jgi:hypothetical protein
MAEVRVSPHPLTARSYMVGLKEALLGFRTYHYKSALVCTDTPVSMLRMAETVEGDVIIFNKSLGGQGGERSSPSALALDIPLDGSDMRVHEVMLNQARDEKRPRELVFTCPLGGEGAVVATLDAADWAAEVLGPGRVRGRLA